jgi:DUF4097 and DUF4098 domain-containing protein YvlB
MQKSFPTDGPLRVDVRVPAGVVEVEAVQSNEAWVELDAEQEVLERTTVELQGDELRIHVRQRRGLFLGLGRDEVHARLRVPEGSRLNATTRSADVRAAGWLESIRVQTASGDVAADRCRTLSAQSASGDVSVTEVLDELSIQTASGDVRVGRAGGKLTIQGVSGDIRVETADGEARIAAVSGDVTAESVAGPHVKVESVSGDVEVGVRRGCRVHVDATSVSGHMRSELDLDDAPAGGADGPLVELRVRTVSGDVDVVRAATPTPQEV